MVSISLLIGGNSGARFLSESLQTQNLMLVRTNAKRGKTHTPSLTRKKMCERTLFSTPRLCYVFLNVTGNNVRLKYVHFIYL